MPFNLLAGAFAGTVLGDNYDRLFSQAKSLGTAGILLALF
jgi:hypothetical protein